MDLEYVNPNDRYDIGLFNRNFRAIEEAINSGTGGGVPLDPEIVYHTERPPDWLPMPEAAENEMYMLVHILPGHSEQIGFRCAPAWQVTVESGTVSDGRFVAKGEIIYDQVPQQICRFALFADDYPDMPMTSDGFRQVLLRISGNIEIFEINQCRAGGGIVEIFCDLPRAKTCKLGFNNASYTHRLLPTLRFFRGRLPELTDAGGMFAYCQSLISCMPGIGGKLINADAMYKECKSLLAIEPVETGQVKLFGQMFYGCEGLRAIPPLDTANGTNFEYAFYKCHSLRSIPELDTGKGTSFKNFCYGCESLRIVPPLDTSSGKNFAGMFGECHELRSIPPLDTGKGTDFAGMFRGCYVLQEVPKLDLTGATSVTQMFLGCLGIRTARGFKAPALTGSAGASGLFSGCTALASVKDLVICPKPAASANTPQSEFKGCALRELTFGAYPEGWTGASFDLSGQQLDHAALIKLIDSLPEITQARKLTLTGNPGAAELMDAEKAVATAKGWEVIV